MGRLRDRYGPAENGRTGEIRTRDQRIKSPLLYRLSYRPIFMPLQIMIQGFDGLFAVKKRDFLQRLVQQTSNYSKMLNPSLTSF